MALVIRYVKHRDEAYCIQIGFSVKTLSAYPTHHYIKRLNMQCVDTNRDLFSFLKREQVQMLQLAKERLTEEQSQEDEKSTVAIQNNFDIINGQGSSLHYVSTALESVEETTAPVHHRYPHHSDSVQVGISKKLKYFNMSIYRFV